MQVESERNRQKRENRIARLAKGLSSFISNSLFIQFRVYCR